MQISEPLCASRWYSSSSWPISGSFCRFPGRNIFGESKNFGKSNFEILFSGPVSIGSWRASSIGGYKRSLDTGDTRRDMTSTNTETISQRTIGTRGFWLCATIKGIIYILSSFDLCILKFSTADVPVLFSVLQSKGVAARKVGKYKKSINIMHSPLKYQISKSKKKKGRR